MGSKHGKHRSDVPRPGPRLLVLDHGPIARATEIIFKRAGSEEKAGAALKVTQEHVNKLRHRKAGRHIGATTLERIGELVPEMLQELERAVISEPIRQVLESYDDWFDRELSRFARSDLARLRRTPSPFEYQLGYAAGAILEWLEGNRVYCGRIRAFEEKMKAAGHTPFEEKIWAARRTPAGQARRSRRVELALLRAVEPLAAHDMTGGVERSLQELEASGKLGAYLDAALGREALLLERSPDLRRAQRAYWSDEEPPPQGRVRKARPRRRAPYRVQVVERGEIVSR